MRHCKRAIRRSKTLPPFPSMVISTIKHSIQRHASVKAHPGIALFQLNAALTFFNADYFKQQIYAAADAARSNLKWFVIDTILIADIDINGLYAFHASRNAFEARATNLVLAGRRTDFLNWFQKIGIYKAEHKKLIFQTPRKTLKAYQHEFLSALPTDY